MRRTFIGMAALLAMLATLLVAAPSQAATVVISNNLGRNAPTYTSYPNDPTPVSKWVQSAQGQGVDTNGNGLEDSLRARAADAETYGIVRHRILDVKLQRNEGTGDAQNWVTASDNEVDAVSPQATAARAFVESYTTPVRYCDANPGLVRQYRVVNYSVSRRVDNVFPNRTTFSHTFVKRMLANDPLCVSPPRTVIDATSPFRTLDTGTVNANTTATPCAWSPSAPEFAADESNIVNATTVDLIRVGDHADNCLGTSLVTDNLGYTNNTGAPVTVRVNYVVSGGANIEAGSVRMFGYADQDVHPRPDEAPDYVDTAEATDGGVLSFTLAPGQTIGYFGLVYDTSNGGVEGTVRFTNLTIGTRTVVFN